MLRRNRVEIACCALFGLAAVATSVLRYLSLSFPTFRSRIFDQAVWSASRGGGLWVGVTQHNMLTHHFMRSCFC
jgi:uncharacterized membrane protein